jgi:hypothetical protein
MTEYLIVTQEHDGDYGWSSTTHSFDACPICYALVPWRDIDRHSEWHGKANDDVP